MVASIVMVGASLVRGSSAVLRALFVVIMATYLMMWWTSIVLWRVRWALKFMARSWLVNVMMFMLLDMTAMVAFEVVVYACYIVISRLFVAYCVP